MKIAVIGSGYVGLVVAACMAESGNDVIGADIDEAKVDGLNQGRVPIVEPGLAPMLERNIAARQLRFTTDIREALRASDLIFLAVGTPPGKDHAADLSAVLSTARLIGDTMNGAKIVVTKSTVPVGTARLIREEIEARTSHPVRVCANPEFLKEGAAVSDFMAPDRVVIGSDLGYAAAILRDLYAPLRAYRTSAAGHGCALRGDHKVCVQRHAGGPHQPHEFDRPSVRSFGRRRALRAARSRFRFVHRTALPLSGA